MTTLMQRFSVGFEFPIIFTRGVFGAENPTFRDAVSRLEPERRHEVLFVVDDNVAAAQPDLAARIRRYCEAHAHSLHCAADPVRVPGGEAAKNDLALVLRIVELVNQHGIDRQSFICAIGGGAVLDMVCFAAAIAHRSVRVVRVPTTVLAQNDSGVGVKSGINFFGKKNFIGAFMPPFAVLNDSDFLATLSHRDLVAGIAEAVKVALIRDREFFLFLEGNAARLARSEPAVMQEQIRRSAELHTRHIGTSGDPFEFGSARPLDFGHWAAHKMESLTHNRLRHGEAVALGMALDTLYSVKKRYLAEQSGERILALLETLGLSLWEPELGQQAPNGDLAVLVGLREFREHLGGRLHITLLKDLGQGFEVTEMDEPVVEECIAALRLRHVARSAGGHAAVQQHQAK